MNKQSETSRRPSRIFIQAISVIAAAAVIATTAFALRPRYQPYETIRADLFNTVIRFTAYTKTEAEFTRYAHIIFDELAYLHQLFDAYHPYEGMNNLWTVNHAAGIAPVTVDAPMIELLLFSQTAYEDSHASVNAALGPVTEIWRQARENAYQNPNAARLPDFDSLSEAAVLTDLQDMIIDGTDVFLSKPGMRLDVGSLAKGYASRRAMEMAVDAGLESGLLTAGGNVVTFGGPKENDRVRWGVGLLHPILARTGQTEYIDRIFITDLAVVSSGGYERYFSVDGVDYAHIIDPSTLMPSNRYAGITVIHRDSLVADMLSTALFILPLEEGEALAQKYNAEAVWISHDGELHATEGYKRISGELSGYSASD